MIKLVDVYYLTSFSLKVINFFPMVTVAALNYDGLLLMYRLDLNTSVVVVLFFSAFLWKT